MDVEQLVTMANDIAAFFDADADKVAAAEGVRFHMSRYWEARMRRAIIAHVEGGGAGLVPTAVAAIRKLAPPAANSPNQSK